MIKMFATDLDGTLLGHGNYLKPKDIEAIAKIKNEMEFTVATGRLDREITEIFKALKTTGHRVSQNGSFVYSEDNNMIHSHTFDPKLGKTLHEAIVGYEQLFCIMTADDIYVSERTPEIKAMEHLFYFDLKEGVDFVESYGKAIHPSKYMLLGEPDEVNQLQEKIRSEIFHEEIVTYMSDKRCLDILPRGISKAFGLEKLALERGINVDEIAVIGDSFNDIPMFEMTPHSYVMSQAPAAVKEKANFVVDHVHEAVSDVLKKMNTVKA
ncbi:HAD family hydrolase [Saliterribacillus persicus]|uniref:Cof subfamily protein (Haloacid dehalogenase superfamily)/HAD superfamily hydrolase (TIGR01484 family) n=1 Tax=Saliterribacillus persicus TaxID=930114 RepID=A0A368X568_9BACI|nr:HAD family hydrolase [Saliterribacillus persicus]RCW62839.1 hypothetical protein DFR57_1228 [Saliterribacillus persicus]